MDSAKKWQKKWQEWSINSFDINKDNKHYVLEMFSYPSASNLHIGHCFNFVPADAYARFKKMCGFNVFQPMGFDAFGLPAENYAIKTGIHPQDCTLKNIEIMCKQLDSLAPMYNWEHSLVTCMPDYYKWTQYLFIKLFNAGLAYQKTAPVNWCTSCNTAIANEQVVDGTCERCGAEVLKKSLNQWFFKITDYAQELLDGLDNLNWPEKTKSMQKNWIGRSSGGEISFNLENDASQITVFTTRADTLMGVTYVVLAPDHHLVNQITTKEQKKAVEDYQLQTAKLTDIERLSEKGEKTGVFTGAYCIHPLTGSKIPVFIADYCLSTYGTGAVMGVPAHDERDYAFAKKYNLSIKRVIKGENNDDLPFTDDGILTNSDEFNDLTSEIARKKILEKLNSINKGREKINYRLRDWSVSRQRYWGCPIPIIHCDSCGAVAVNEEDLPVTLPKDVDFTPDGKSPLHSHEGFMNTTCPKCGKKAVREADTLDTFVCSSWYFLRYPDNKNDTEPFNRDIIKKMLPVDVYVGGAEHACMHLLYARFFVKALRDIGLLNFDEPFTRLIHQGMILGKDGEKMSKSRGNVVNPDQYISQFGTDALRLYLMFGFCYIDGGPWSDDGMRAIPKFIDRMKRIIIASLELKVKDNPPTNNDNELEYALNYCIKNVRADIESFSFNTAVARIMELVNAMYKYQGEGEVFKRAGLNLIRIIAPFTPYLAEDLNELSGVNQSVFSLPYPDFNAKALILDEVEIAVQINSKIVGKIVISTSISENEIINIAKQQIPVLKDKQIKKSILIKNRLINLII